MGYVTGGGTSGSGGAVSTVAGRTGDVTLAVADVSGAAPLANPTFTGTVVVPNSAVTNAMLAGSIAASKVTGTAVTAADTGTVTSAMIADATIVSADLSATAGITSGQLAGSIAESKVTNLTTDLAASKILAPGRFSANPEIVSYASGTNAVVTTLLKPTFIPVKPPAESYVLSGLGCRVGTVAGSSTVGMAIYSIAYSGSGTYAASKVAQLNAALVTTTSAGIFMDLVTTGAAASGAGTVTLDFTANEYVVGLMASTATTLAIFGQAVVSGLGCLNWTATARSNTDDWPSSFTQSSAVANAGTGSIKLCYLENAAGVNWL